uniref:NADH dehydrogenase subunit 9 n=1 Tax=Bakuella subtropica TaxID=1295181 RepID=UPI0023F01763|nr:NADH dehydrogenase subunit 9 [Bakuella subtropica]WDY80892.1 NADH dehydrogenase subunit 9 [Bakuella subtropica]
MFLNDLFFLSVLILFFFYQFSFHSTPFFFWLIGGSLLILLGILGLSLNQGILIGFLWIIDFGVGLIFLIFLSSLTSLFEKENVISSFWQKKWIALALSPFFFFIIFFVSPNIYLTNRTFFEITFFFVDYYSLTSSVLFSSLTLLREIFFFHHSFLFILINCFIFIALIGIIILNFTLKFVINMSIFQKSTSPIFLKHSTSIFFRQQDFIEQQRTPSSSRLWKKKKHTSFSSH